MAENIPFKVTELMKKYTQIYAMYIEYPHKSIWSGATGDADYRKAVRELLAKDPETPLLLYFHFPFCRKQCFYCTCHTFITGNYARMKEHLGFLFKEIDLFRRLLDEIYPGGGFKPNFKEIHLGGGSPTLLAREDFDALVSKLSEIADINKLGDFSIEIDPRNVDIDSMRYYHSKGVNRISFGVQDFDPEVQKAVNRVQPAELLEGLLTPEIRSYYHGINFDIMWGLPGQTVESYRETIKTCLRLSPDRISLLLMHYAPDVIKHQKLMDVSKCPSVLDRTTLFTEAAETLTANGYVRVGLEHFAKPGDELSQALKKGTLHWNSLGYTAGSYSDVVAFGSGSSSTITENWYFQNEYSLEKYEKTVASGTFPIFRGHRLTADDKVRRAVIHGLRTYFGVDFAVIDAAHGIKFEEYFAKELLKAAALEADGILVHKDRKIKITALGRYFTFQVCRIFDNYLRDNK